MFIKIPSEQDSISMYLDNTEYDRHVYPHLKFQAQPSQNKSTLKMTRRDAQVIFY